MASNSKVLEWKEAAIQDGWMHGPVYKLESEATACWLKKDGWEVQVYIRPNNEDVVVWGPDTLVVEVLYPYNMELLKKQLRKCRYCKKEDVDTRRVGFAGRVCEKCYPEQKKLLEYPGWDN